MAEQPLLPMPLARPRRRGGPVTIVVGRRSAWLTGSGLGPVLDELDIPHMRCPFRRQLTCPVDRLDDVIAVLEYRDRRTVTVEAIQ